jgi:hypothetical protein
MRLAQLQMLTVMMMIGDGAVALLWPRRDIAAWMLGPKGWQNQMHALGRHPGWVRAIGAAEIAAALLWARNIAPPAGAGAPPREREWWRHAA